MASSSTPHSLIRPLATWAIYWPRPAAPSRSARSCRCWAGLVALPVMIIDADGRPRGRLASTIMTLHLHAEPHGGSSQVLGLMGEVMGRTPMRVVVVVAAWLAALVVV